MIEQKKSTRHRVFKWGMALLVFCAAVFLLQAILNKQADVSNELESKVDDFVLQSAEGDVALEDYRGKIVVLYFGYAFCPDVCPTSLGLLSLALNELTSEELSNVKSFFISVDPERDTVERLKAYAEAFHSNITGITGTPLNIAQVTQDYGVMYMKVDMPDSALGYAVDHSSRYYVLNRDGLLSHTIEHGSSPKEIASVLKAVIKHGE